MRNRKAKFSKGMFAAIATVFIIASFIVAGCTGSNGASSGTVNMSVSPVMVPVSITDAPNDQVVAASLTLDSVVLTDSKGTTTSILSAPLTFEAAHLDAVQEPLFTPAIPVDTYTSVALTYSNAQVAYIDPTTKQLVLVTATFANTSQVFTFPATLNVNNSVTSLLVDYLVADSVAISGSTVTVTPHFNVVPAPIAAQPTNGTNGLQCGILGKVSALGSNQFTLTNAEGVSLLIDVSTNTQYQGLSGFSALEVGALVEVDAQTESNGNLLALRVAEQVPPKATAELLVGPVIATTGSPVTSFTEIVRQEIGPPPVATPIEKDTITVTGSTQFQLPGRFDNVQTGLPFTPVFNASTLFAGQVVAVDTNGVSDNGATAVSVALAPQTVTGTITGGVAPACIPCWAEFTLALPSDSWLATVTGQTVVDVYVPPSGMQTLPGAPSSVSSIARFNGYLFSINGTLTLVAVVEGPPPGTAIGPAM